MWKNLYSIGHLLCFVGQDRRRPKERPGDQMDTTTHLVVLELEGPMGVYRIERTPDSTKLFIDGKPVLPEAWRKGEMQDTINATFKSDPKTFFSATML